MDIHAVMKEVALADGSGTAPVQLMWSNAVGGPEGPVKRRRPPAPELELLGRASRNAPIVTAAEGEDPRSAVGAGRDRLVEDDRPGSDRQRVVSSVASPATVERAAALVADLQEPGAERVAGDDRDDEEDRMPPCVAAFVETSPIEKQIPPAIPAAAARYAPPRPTARTIAARAADAPSQRRIAAVEP